jgi:uncharacterized protein (TIGR02271 family)
MTRTITALYDSRDHAEAARAQLATAGVGASQVQITSSEGAPSSSGSHDTHSGGGFLQGLKDFFMADDDRHAYGEGVRRGGYLLTARVEESQADEVCRVLESSDPVDFDERQAQWRSEGWTGAPDTTGFSGSRGTGADMDDEAIPVVEEQLRVGKREVERGGVRVRSYVEETPVQEQVNLREEHVEIERRPMDQRIAGSDADNLFQERSIELAERGEEAVVAKEAIVREEILVHKDVDQRTETISDTVRHTEVDVDDTRGQALHGDGRTFGDSQRSGGGLGERASFTSGDDDTSVAMDPDHGSRVNETEEERQRRLEHERGRGSSF